MDGIPNLLVIMLEEPKQENMRHGAADRGNAHPVIAVCLDGHLEKVMKKIVVDQ